MIVIVSIISVSYIKGCCCVVTKQQSWSCPTLCDPIDCSPPGSSVHGIFQEARTLEWVAISFPRGSSQPRGRSCISCIGRWFFFFFFFTTEPPGKPTSKVAAAAAKSLQSCLTLCDPIDGNPPGSAVPGILQARTLEWVAISFGQDQTVSPIILAFRILSVAECIVFPSYWITSLTKEDIPVHCHVTSSVSLMVHYIVLPHYQAWCEAVGCEKTL